jgi:probable F420-dependent oxidoreductase
VKLGVMFSHPDIGNDPGAIRDHVQALEGVGFDYVATPEHVIGCHPDRLEGEKLPTHEVPYHEPFVLLGPIAALTTRLELMTSVLVLPQRQTVLVAKQAAELDLLSGGRLHLGVGVGRNWMEYEALDMAFDDRGRRIEEQVELLRLLWTEEVVSFDGTWHRLDRMGLNPGLGRRIPIWMGSFYGRLVERVLERTGRLADGWMPQFPPGEDLAAAIARLRGYATKAGRDPDGLGIECVTRIRTGDDPETWRETALAYRGLGATHLKVWTAGGGYVTPEEHGAAALAWYDAVADLAAPAEAG